MHCLHLTRCFSLCVIVLGLLFNPTAAQAQITEDEYWSRLEQTEQLINRALEESSLQNAATRDEIRELWIDVDQVERPDGATQMIDTRWLTEPLIFDNDANLEKLREQVQVLQDYHNRETSASSTGSNDLDALDDVLADPRFQYEEIEPTPVPELPEPINVEAPNFGFLSGLSRMVLIVLGIGVVIAVLLFIASGLRTKPIATEIDLIGNDDPETAHDAQQMATSSAADMDYRNAIRYLYLASLLLLDEHGLIHYDQALTNREHLRQVANDPTLVAVLRPVINVFEDVWYGFAPVDEALYQEFRAYVDRLNQMAAQTA